MISILLKFSFIGLMMFPTYSVSEGVGVFIDYEQEKLIVKAKNNEVSIKFTKVPIILNHFSTFDNFQFNHVELINFTQRQDSIYVLFSISLPSKIENDSSLCMYGEENYLIWVHLKNKDVANSQQVLYQSCIFGYELIADGMKINDILKKEHSLLISTPHTKQKVSYKINKSENGIILKELSLSESD